jgi:hypothetical protein
MRPNSGNTPARWHQRASSCLRPAPSLACFDAPLAIIHPHPATMPDALNTWIAGKSGHRPNRWPHPRRFAVWQANPDALR